MSFRCQICDAVQPTNTPVNKVVLETRPKTYHYVHDREHRTSSGSEIVQEVSACGECAESHFRAA